jgi:predicted GIY-YIG superfamily endonuclease
MNSIQIGGYLFNGPYLLSNFDEIDKAAVYAILCKLNETYYVIYIGQSGELGTRLQSHNKKECWEKHCKGTLYVAIFNTPSTTYSAEQRRLIERELINEHNPVCNKI